MDEMEELAIEMAGKYALSRAYFIPKFRELLDRMPLPNDPVDRLNFESLIVFIGGLDWRIRDALTERS